MEDLTVEQVVDVFQTMFKTTPTSDVFNETYDVLCQVSWSRAKYKGQVIS